MDDYYTMRGINFSSKRSKVSLLSHNHDTLRNNNNRSTYYPLNMVSTRASRHWDLGRQILIHRDRAVCSFTDI